MGCASSTVTQATHAQPDFFDNYVLGLKIGKGAYAQVRVASKKDKTKSQSSDSDIEDTPREFAVKILDLEPRKRDGTHQKLQKMASNEVGVWNNVGSYDHCVRLHETFFDAHACYMVMEKCECSLLGHLERMPEINERTLGCLLVQMLKGIEHVHSAKVVHRDVKPDNFLVGGDSCSVVKLSDFGLARMLPDKGKLHGVYGTAPFMAPEMLEKQPYAHEIDVWSFGVLAYTLFFGAFPYEPIDHTSAAMKDAILDGIRPKFRATHRNGVLRDQKRSDTTTAFVKAMLIRDPKTRPTASAALRLPFMVACADSKHMPGVELPSLRATVQAAKKVGLFEIRDLCKECVLDKYLNDMHFTKHGGALPEVDPVVMHEGMTKVVNPGVVQLKPQKVSANSGPFPPNLGRFQSHPWEDASDSTSCGNSGIDSTTSSRISSKISQISL